MRKIIIDTDTGSDDAVALMMALKSDDVDILAITTVCGNVPQNLATQNALMTVEVCDSDVKVYPGAVKPLFRNLVTAVNVHGDDGMGDLDLIHPTKKSENINAVDKILELIKKYPNEIEIVSLGPVTNLALAILKEPETMKMVKHIYSMGTGGFGPGNTTPVAEFNVFVDAESYSIMLNSGIPVTIIGYDLCVGSAAWNKKDIDFLSSQTKVSKFAVDCNRQLLNYNIKRSGQYIVDLPDAVAMAVALWEDVVKDKVSCYCYCCTKEEESYGQVVVFSRNQIMSNPFYKEFINKTDNAFVIKDFDYKTYKQRLRNLLIK